MRKLAFIILLVALASKTYSQCAASDIAIICKTADYIISHTAYTVSDKEGKAYTTTQGLVPDKQYNITSPYLEWKYWNGVLNLAMFELSSVTGDEKYKQQALKNYRFIFDNISFFEKLYTSGIQNTGMDQYYRMEMLDDCGAMAAGLCEAYALDKNERYLDYLHKTAEYMLHKEYRLKDGTLARTGPYDKTVWLDDLYMSVPFLARYGKLNNDTSFFSFAAKQIALFTHYLYDKYNGLYYHCYFDSMKQNGVAHWGRANGWCIMAQVNLLGCLPIYSPLKDTLLAIYRQQVNNLARYQSESGLWHQLLDKSDSYLETSCSAMFTYAIAKGVNEGWLDKRYSTIALAGWKGLKTKIQPDGQVADICIGTGIENNLVFYYKRPTMLNDIHGLGAVLLAGCEVVKLK
ncbi:MAG TPA: glycoside hydrolase family 88 protein [Bacteroidales bacterium]|nr:glycoside hydrolase family 88 protein [Bacteroidales bacterium]